MKNNIISNIIGGLLVLVLLSIFMIFVPHVIKIEYVSY